MEKQLEDMNVEVGKFMNDKKGFWVMGMMREELPMGMVAFGGSNKMERGKLIFAIMKVFDIKPIEMMIALEEYAESEATREVIQKDV